MRDFLLNFFAIFYITGFMIVSIIPQLFGLVGESFTIVYRGSVVIIAIILFFYYFKKNAYRLLNYNGIGLFVLFWLFYVCRFLYDFNISESFKYNIERDIMYYYNYLLGVVLIPCIVLHVVDIKDFNYRLIVKRIFEILLVTSIVGLFFRLSSGTSGRSIDGIEIGVLMYGQFNATLSILGVYYLCKNPISFKSIYYLAGVFIGILGIFVSASRSPLLSLLIVSLVFIARLFGSFKMIFILLVIVVIAFFYLEDLIFFFDSIFQTSFYERLILAFYEGGDKTRSVLYIQAIEEFFDSPFLGSAILIQNIYPGSYPHNLIIESFMALGVIGGVLFLYYIVKCLKAMWYMLNFGNDEAAIGLLFLQYFLFGMFSGNIFSSYLFWFLSLWIVKMYNNSVQICR